MTFYQTLLGYSYAQLEQEIKLGLGNISAEENTFIPKLKQYKSHPNQWPGMNKIENPAVREMLLRMLDPDPQKRPSTLEIEEFFSKKF